MVRFFGKKRWHTILCGSLQVSLTIQCNTSHWFLMKPSDSGLCLAAGQNTEYALPTDCIKLLRRKKNTIRVALKKKHPKHFKIPKCHRS